jgi:hypothetical protein
MDFEGFPKIARLSRECVVTEKLDGTNAQVWIRPGVPGEFETGRDTQLEVAGLPAYLRAGSRTRWISSADDNYGFAAWVYQHAPELAQLGFGRHFGEWWGYGINRSYDMPEKRFSLFNTHRWSNPAVRPGCCDVVPVLAQGLFDTVDIDAIMDSLAAHGSAASPGFMNPEGLVIYHTAAKTLFKKTLEHDAEWKGKFSKD